MTTTRETIPGTRDVGQRLADCDLNTVANIAEVAGVSTDDAWKVFNVYHKAKVFRGRDLTNRRWQYKHGAFIAREPMLRALAHANSK